MPTSRVLSAACLALGLSIVGPEVAAQHVTLTPIGFLSGGPTGRFDTYAYAVNAAGQVVGFSGDAEGRTQAFLTGPAGAGISGLGFLHSGPTGSVASAGYGVNDRGQVVGYSIDALGRRQAFLTGPDGRGMAPLGFLHPTPTAATSSLAYGVNASGQVTGYSIDAYGRRQAFLTGPDGRAMTGLGFLATGGTGTLESTGYAVNASGQVTGFSTDAQGRTQAFLTGPDGRGMEGLGFLGTDLDRPYVRSVGTSVNAAGQVTGSFTDARGFTQAFVTAANGRGMTGLGLGGGTSPCGPASYGSGINASGAVVGNAVGHFSTLHRWCEGRAFLHTATGGMQFFDALLAASGTSGWFITAALAISDDGHVAAIGYRLGMDGGAPRAIMLRVSLPTTVPEPTTWVLLGTGLLALGGGAVRRRRA